MHCALDGSGQLLALAVLLSGHIFWYLVIGRLDGPQGQSGLRQEGKKVYPCPEMNPNSFVIQP